MYLVIKNQMIRAFFFLTISFVTYSCSLEFGSSNNSNDMKEVDDLQRKLNALEFSFKSIDTIAVETALIRYRENLTMIKKYYNDTVDKEFVQLINKYKGIKKAGKNISKKDRKDISTNIKITKNQLHNLSLDLDSDILPKDSISYFIKMESDKINKLNKDISNYILICDEVIQLDTSLSSKVRDLVNN